MTDGPKHRVQYRRKRKGLTNYRKRLELLKSGKLRFVIRKSNNATTCQIVEYHADGDKTLVTTSSLDLKKYGYKGHPGNIPAAYLTGLMCGLKALKSDIKEAILDTGLYNLTKGSRIYAALKGIVDAGINVPHNEKIFPQERVLQGYNIENYAKILQSDKPEEYEKVFSKLLKNKLQPEKFVEHFQETKKRIMGEFA